jgi:hypothetical protein
MQIGEIPAGCPADLERGLAFSQRCVHVEHIEDGVEL